MRNIHYYFFCLVLALFNSCASESGDNSKIKCIDIEKNLFNFKNQDLASLNVRIRYVPLATQDDLILRGAYHLDLNMNNILVSDWHKCLLYDLNGKLKREIGRRGKGPGEYRGVTSVKLGQDKIFIKGYEHIFVFSYEGVFLDKFPVYKTEASLLSTFMPINDSLFFGFVPNYSGSEYTRNVIFTQDSVIKRYPQEFSYEKKERSGIASFTDHSNIIRLGSAYYFKEMLSDTMYVFGASSGLEPKYVFKIGSYLPPTEDRYSLTLNELEDYVFLENVFLTNEYIFLDCSYGKYTPVRRTKPENVMGANNWYYTTRLLGVYNKTTGKLGFTNMSASENKLSQTGLINNIDGGPRFYPNVQVNDSTLGMWIRPEDMIAHIKSQEFINSDPQSQVQKDRLKYMVDSISENDNPIIMLLTFIKD